VLLERGKPFVAEKIAEPMGPTGQRAHRIRTFGLLGTTGQRESKGTVPLEAPVPGSARPWKKIEMEEIERTSYYIGIQRLAPRSTTPRWAP
jgi:hypothetical protein